MTTRDTKPIPSRPVNALFTPSGVQVVTGSPGTSFHEAGRVTSTPGIFTIIKSFTVAADTTRFVEQIKVVCNVSACWEFSVGGVIIASGINNAARPNSYHEFKPVYGIPTGVVGELRIKVLTGKPAISVDGYVSGGDFLTT